MNPRQRTPISPSASGRNTSPRGKKSPNQARSVQGRGTGKRSKGRAQGHRQARKKHGKFPRVRVQTLRQGAQNRLRQFRQGSALAVALTAMILLIWVGEEQAAGQEEPAPSLSEAAEESLFPSDPAASLEQATGTVRELLMGFYALMPRLAIAVVFIAVAVAVGKAIQALARRSLGRWERVNAFSALIRIAVFLIAGAAALSVLAGDARALFGSIGLVGLALSWALQTPIESFSGWLMNSFRGYYRVGDRIEVGEVFGDVYKIDVLTTTVWEAGGPGKPVSGAQSTGAMVTFPNWEVLRSNIINYSRDFPYVWDEVTVGVANESDLRYTIEVFERAARELFGKKMEEPANLYHQLLARARLAFDVDEEPKAFISLNDSWSDCTIRYLVPVRSRRRWASELSIALTEESAKPEHHGKIIGAYPRQEIRIAEDFEKVPET